MLKNLQANAAQCAFGDTTKHRISNFTQQNHRQASKAVGDNKRRGHHEQTLGGQPVAAVHPQTIDDVFKQERASNTGGFRQY